MSNDVTIQSIAPARSANDPVGGVNTATLQPTSASQPVAKPPPIYNPTMQFDSSLGLVVIAFRNEAGSITTQIPSQGQLDAYQRWSTTRLGPAPPGLHEPPARAAVTPAVTPQASAVASKETSAK